MSALCVDTYSDHQFMTLTKTYVNGPVASSKLTTVADAARGVIGLSVIIFAPIVFLGTALFPPSCPFPKSSAS